MNLTEMSISIVTCIVVFEEIELNPNGVNALC